MTSNNSGILCERLFFTFIRLTDQYKLQRFITRKEIPEITSAQANKSNDTAECNCGGVSSCIKVTGVTVKVKSTMLH